MMREFEVLAVLGAFAMVLGLACGKSGISPKTCYSDGKTYQPGDSFQRDCNTCSCGANGEIGCTLMACPGDASFPVAPDAAVPTDQATPMGDAQPKDMKFVSPDLNVSQDALLADATTPDGKPVADAGDAGVDARQSCVWQDMVLSIGQSADAGDGCNICECTVSGMACTTRACVSTRDAATLVCSLSSSLSFGYDGGLVAYSDSYALDGEGQMPVERIDLSGRDGGIASCSPPLPTCGAPGVVSISTIAQDLTDADVQLAFGLTLSHVYGVDSRPSDGAVWSISRASGGNILVGNPCLSPMMNSCQPIPPGIQRLADDLKSLAAAAVAAPECAEL